MTLLEALQHPNVQAFLRVIRAGESSQGREAYYTLVGGGQVDDLSAHPNRSVYIPSLRVNSTAAGAYQFLYRTWEECRKALSLPDFRPDSQDLAAVYLIQRRGALEAVLEGRLEDAIRLCAKEWASLPGSPYGQPTRTLDQARATYLQYGGTLAGAPRSDPYLEEGNMPLPALAIVKAVLPTLVGAIPQLGKIFGSGSEVSERNIKALEVASDVLVKATNAANLQEATERIVGDPAVQQAAIEAVRTNWFDISVAEAGGGGIEGAAKRAETYFSPGHWFWLNPAFWISTVLLSFPTMLMVDLFWIHPEVYEKELRVQIVTAILAVIGMVGGYWIGTSLSSARKDSR